MPTATKEKKGKKSAAAKAKKVTAKGTIHMAILLDESGSMGGNQKAVVDGTNEFVGTLRGEKNSERTKVTLAMFDHRAQQPMCRIHREAVKLDKFEEISQDDYRPTGSTPLNDAIAETISKVEAGMKKNDKAMLVIFTDGYENASAEYPGRGNAQLKALIERKEKEGFTFIYLGANVNAQKEGAAMGVSTPGTFFNTTASPKGTRSAMRAGGQMASSYLESGGVYDAEAFAAKHGDTIPEEEGDQPVWTPDADSSVAEPKGKTSTDAARSVLRDE